MAVPLFRGSRPGLPLDAVRSAASINSFLKRYLNTTASFDSYLVSPKELHEALSKNAKTKISTAPRVIPVCASWFLPNDSQKRTGQQVFREKRIPSAVFFDLDEVKDHDSPYPHMLPTEETFAEAMSELGIRKDDEVVVYDTHELGIFSAPRVAWTLRVFGHPGAFILNNFRKWVREGYPTQSGEHDTSDITRTEYPRPTFQPDMVVTFRELKEIASDHGKEGAEGVQILDARSPGRFTGADPEPRPGLSSGHMPGSINLPLPEILDPITKAFLPPEELRKVLESKGVDPEKPVITTCGTGVMASALLTALDLADHGKTQDRRVYDGSWTEWAQRVSPTDGFIRKTA